MGEDTGEVDKIAMILQKFPDAFELDAKAVQIIKQLKAKAQVEGPNSHQDNLKLFQTQLNANEVLFVALAKSFNDSKLFKARAKDKLNQLKLLSEKTVSKFNEAISKLREKDLHQAFVRQGMSKLIDVYYSQEKMEKWKAGCEANFQALNTRLNAGFEELKLTKQEIILKNAEVKKWAKTCNELVQQLQKLDGQGAEHELLFQAFADAYVEYRKRLQSIMTGGDVSQFPPLLEDLRKKLSAVEASKPEASRSKVLEAKLQENIEIIRGNIQFVGSVMAKIDKLNKEI